MGTTVCVLLVAIILIGGLLLAGWHVIAAILHLAFSILRLLFHWPVLLAILVVLIAVLVLFQR
jgi:hypothetical protein